VKKILLTGSTGFIGSAVLKKLSKKNIIFCINRRKNNNLKINRNVNNIHFKNYDQLNLILKKIKVDAVIHCATHYVKTHTHDDIKKLTDTNLLFGNIILDNLQNMNVKTFINLSTVWENYDGIKDNYFNLYSVYKKNFVNIIKYYIKIFRKVKFFNFYISDTFGLLDKRLKIINTLKLNFRKNKTTKIISSKLYLNLINVEDITDALIIALKHKSEPGEYNLINKKNINIKEIVDRFNLQNNKKLKVKWLSKKFIKEKIYKKKQFKKWSPKKSCIKHIIDLINQ
jgi:nucleoside-diphosphate-sugar epimerase